METNMSKGELASTVHHYTPLFLFTRNILEGDRHERLCVCVKVVSLMGKIQQ